MKNTSLYSILLILICCSCKQNAINAKQKTSTGSLPYDLTKPDKMYILAENLKEISGIAAVNDSIIACIGDEKGTVYFYNLNAAVTAGKLKFTDKGDFEDLALAGDTIFVLDSKGVIWTIKNFTKKVPEIMSAPLQIEEPFELEGLCYYNNNLYTAAKYFHNKKKDSKGSLPVWKLSLPSMAVENAFFSLPDFIEDPSIGSVPFHTSAILFNERVKEWYALSTHSKAFIRCNTAGHPIETIVLSAIEFSQPEGICITRKGDLLISNEGREGPPTILLFLNKSNK